jgi:hypothetical protein
LGNSRQRKKAKKALQRAAEAQARSILDHPPVVATQKVESWPKAIGAASLAFVALVGSIATAYQIAGVQSVLFAHLILVVGWVGFVASFFLLERVLSLPRPQVIRLTVAVAVASGILMLGMDLGMVYLKRKERTQDQQLDVITELLKNQDKYRPERLLERYPKGYVIYEINYSNKVFPYGKQGLESFQIHWETAQIVNVSDEFVDIQLPDFTDSKSSAIFFDNAVAVPKRVGGLVNVVGMDQLQETVELVAIRETGFVFLIGFRAPKGKG